MPLFAFQCHAGRLPGTISPKEGPDPGEPIFLKCERHPGARSFSPSGAVGYNGCICRVGLGELANVALIGEPDSTW